MNITVVGAGALGAVYGTKLAHAARVVFVVRDLERAPRLIHIDRVNGAAPHGDVLDAPRMATEIPDDTDAILCTVRLDQLDAPLVEKLARANKMVAMLPPVLPPRERYLRDKLGENLVCAMPGVIAYEPTDTPHERRVRYWTPRTSPTLLCDHPMSRAVVESMLNGGLPAAISPHAGAIQSATTIAFFAILTSIAAAGGSIDAMANNKELMRLGFAATKEVRAVANTVGALPQWANLFFKFSSPLLARAGIKLGQSKVPEAFVFLEKHFGNKLSEQNAALFQDIETIASQHGLPLDSLRKLLARV